MFSKACEYGIRAGIFIANQSKENKRVSLKDIAAYIDSPVAFTAKILQQMVRNKVIDSVKGPHGGFEINKDKLSHLSLSDIVNAIDGKDIYSRCVLGLDACSEMQPCPVHGNFKIIRTEIKLLLDNTKIVGLSEDLARGKTFLKI